jgi:hypothetical protein
MFGLRCYHQFLFGREFVLVTDHKPLLGMLGESTYLSPMDSARVQRWATTLSGYQYQLRYKSGKDNANADACSRLPLPEEEPKVEEESEGVVQLLQRLQGTPVTAEQINTWTRHDRTLSRVYQYIAHGWSVGPVEEGFTPYKRRANELSIDRGCILWGYRVVIPPPGRKLILEELHEGHPGVARMKALGRTVVWWPQMDREIEEVVQGCTACRERQRKPPQASLHVWSWPDRPWVRLHVDYASPFMGKTFFITIDAHSKWIEAQIVEAARAQTTVECLRSMFATHGLPEQVVSDNGSVFTSQDFKDFMDLNGIDHIRVSPYHPSSNGLAESAVQIVKSGLAKTKGSTLACRLAKVLFAYSITLPPSQLREYHPQHYSWDARCLPG